MNATIGIYFDGRMSKKGSRYVKYAIYYQGKQNYISSGIILEDEEVAFLKKHKAGLPGSVKDFSKRNLWNMIYGDTYIDQETGIELPGILRMARTVSMSLGDNFTIQEFTHRLNNPDKSPDVSGDILQDMLRHAQALRKTENIGDASLFECAATSIRRFAMKDSIRYTEITQNFLERYEKWMLTEGKTTPGRKKKDGTMSMGRRGAASSTTIGMYLRQVQRMFNVSGESANHYPFGKNGYAIPSGKNIKKALKKEDIIKIIECDLSQNEAACMYRDLWVFSYLSNGINFFDMLNLKWSDISKDGAHIEFVRQKTKNKKRTSLGKVSIDVLPITKGIIDRWGSKKQTYIFPFFNDDMTLDRKRSVKTLIVGNTNRYMRKLANHIVISADITTYTARHSFATILMQSEVPLAFISQKLSHSSLKTTQIYLGSFEDDQAKKYLSNLLPG